MISRSYDSSLNKNHSINKIVQKHLENQKSFKTNSVYDYTISKRTFGVPTYTYTCYGKVCTFCQNEQISYNVSKPTMFKTLNWVSFMKPVV